MNTYEKRMLELLLRARDSYGVVAVKSEFEAEGTRVDELLRLLEITRKAGLKSAIKIGGCEANRDLIECRLYGADHIIAPMVETPYALSKYIASKDKIYPADEREDVTFLFNVETRSTFDHIEALGKAAAQGGVGFVLGRVDFAGSMGHQRDFVTSDEMIGYGRKVAEVAKRNGLDLVVGGGVNSAGIDALRQIREVHLDRFETRKVVFDASVLNDHNRAVAGIELAVEFELLWLKNKRDYYRSIAAEDEARIAMMEKRQSMMAAA